MLKRMAALLCVLTLVVSTVFSANSVAHAAECVDVNLKVAFENVTDAGRGNYAKTGDQVDLVFYLGEAKNADGSVAGMTGYQFKVVYDPNQLQPQKKYFSAAEETRDGWTFLQSNITDQHELNGLAYMTAGNTPSWEWNGGEFLRLHFTVVGNGSELDTLKIDLPLTSNVYTYGTQTNFESANIILDQSSKMYIDNTAPVIYLEGNAAQTSQTYDYYPIKVTAEDNSNDKVIIMMDGKEVKSISKTGTVTATDKAGNESSVDVKIKAENFDNVKNMIQALPDAEDATYENKADIAAIDTLLNKLSAEAKAKIDMTRYNAVKNVFADVEKDIANVENLINDLGTIDFTSKTQLQAIEQEMDRLAQLGVKNTQYSNYATYESAKADYDAMIANIKKINEKLAALEEWKYSNHSEYSSLQSQMKKMEENYAVPDTEWNSNGIKTLEAYVKKCLEAEEAMDAVKVLVDALPQNVSVEDLIQINKASSAWDKLKSNYALTDDEITAHVGVETLEKLRAAESSVQESLDRIKDVEQRIDALFQNGKVQYGVQNEIAKLEKIIAGEGELTQTEISAISQDSLNKLESAKSQLETLQKAVDELDAALANFSEPSYPEKATYEKARTVLEALKMQYAVPDTAFKNLEILIKAETFIAEIETEITAVREAYNAIPTADKVKVTDEKDLINLQARYEALLELGVSEKEIAANTQRLADALAAIDSLWTQSAQLNEKLVNVPETVTYADQDGLVELQNALKALEKRGIAITTENYTNLPVYEKAWEALNAIIANVEKIEADIAALTPWKLGRSEQYQTILDQIAQMAAVNVTEEDISNYGTLLECMELEEQAQAALNEIIAEIEKLPTPCTEKDQEAVKAVQALVDALKQAPYQMTEDEIKDVLNAMAGKDIYGVLQQAIQDSMPEPSEPSDSSKPDNSSKPSEGGENVATGDIFPFVAVFVLLLSAAAVLVLKKKEQANNL